MDEDAHMQESIKDDNDSVALDAESTGNAVNLIPGSSSNSIAGNTDACDGDTDDEDMEEDDVGDVSGDEIVEINNIEPEEEEEDEEETEEILEVPAVEVSQKAELEEAFDEIEVRFLINLPVTVLNNNIELMKELEQAWWYYEDKLADLNPKLPHFKSESTFCKRLFDYSQILLPLRKDVDRIVKEYFDYKKKIPCGGGILLSPNMEQILLIRSSPKAKWGFPKGKINENEPLFQCAIREVREEVGFDGREHALEDQFIEATKNGKQITLYFMLNVPTNYEFKLQKKEIYEARWFKFHDLKRKIKENAKELAVIRQTILKIDRWVYVQKKSKNISRTPKPKGGSVFDVESILSKMRKHLKLPRPKKKNWEKQQQ